jgi:sensor histidine kinase regulating citrate/malate metabolism
MITIFYSGVDFSGKFMPKLLMTVFFVCMLLGNILVFYAFQSYTEGLYKKSEYQVEIMHQKAEILRLNQITEMNENYKEMIHNTSNFLKVIKEMAAENKNEDIYELVKDVDESFGANIVKVYSNYKILNTLLAENEARAQKCGVEFDAYVEQGTNLDNISDLDMISMLGNLLDNAVTAASKKPEHSLVKVRIFMQNEGSICVVKIVNDYVEKLVRKDGKLQTTKKAGGLHGIGMSSVNRTAEKYDGYLEYYTEEDKFVSVLVLPIRK